MLESDYRESVKSRAYAHDTYNADVVGLNAMPDSHFIPWVQIRSSLVVLRLALLWCMRFLLVFLSLSPRPTHKGICKAIRWLRLLNVSRCTQHMPPVGGCLSECL